MKDRLSHSVRAVIKKVCSPSEFLPYFCVRESGPLVFSGNYASWTDAQAHATGYDSDEIFQRVYDAALKVKRGDAVFERDAVCFYHEEYRWETLACMLLVANKSGGRLNVLDFGGALGSFYFQHKKFLSELLELNWGVVEQKHLVVCGRSEFEEGGLRFFSSIDECAEATSLNIIFLSGVLQYLEKPYELLAMLGEKGANWILIDRTTFVEAHNDRLVIQRVPASIFQADLPMRIFSEKSFDSAMNQLGYFREVDFPCSEGVVGEIKFIGILYKKNKL